jgi:hypothetical protein
VGDVAFDFSTLSNVAAGDASASAPVVGVAGLVDALDQVELVDVGAGVVSGECSLPVPAADNEAAQASPGAAYQYAAPTNDTAAVLMDQHLVSSAGVL